MKVAYWVFVIIVTGLLVAAGRGSATFGIVFLIASVAVFKVVQRLTATNTTVPPPASPPPAARAPLRMSPPRASRQPVYEPPSATGQSLEPWSPTSRLFEVAGEYFRMANIADLFAGLPTDSPGGYELQEPAQLVADPSNPHDPNAVAVYVRDLHVGYLERQDAVSYHQPIAEVARRGYTVQVDSRQWARGRPGDLGARVTLQLPPPNGFLPANDFPPGAFVIPRGSTMQVTQEDQHMDVLRPLLQRHGHEVPLAATLHRVAVERARSTITLVQVQVDGQPVGVLSPVQSSNLEALIGHIAERGRTPVVRAVLKGNAIKAEVTLYVSKAQNLDPAALASLESPPQN